MTTPADLLAFIAASPEAPTPEALCAFVVRALGAERGFLRLDGAPPRIWAVDMDGFALGNGGERFPVELLPNPPSAVSRRAEPTTALAITGALGLAQLTLLLEHRFRRDPLGQVTDTELSGWFAALAVGLRWSLDVLATHPVGGVPDAEEDSADEHAPWDDQAAASVAALEQTNWNISRAARQLGITRHGLKKRMRRYGLDRQSEP
ncbi:MAG: Bacterial regulatory protein Fis family [Pseudomonadota bacterium]